MKKFMLAIFVLALFCASVFTVAFAEVDVKSNGSKVATAVAVDFYGASVTKVGGNALVDVTALTGDIDVTGALDVSGDADVGGDVTVDTDIYANRHIFVDDSIYMVTASPAAAAGVGLWISQPDGGCSKCYVDAAGTTWACANATCPTGM